MAKIVAPASGFGVEHVFDFLDGLRLIVRRERSALERVCLHVESSLCPLSPLWRQAEDGSLSFSRYLALCVRRFAKLSGERRALPLAGVSSVKRVTHWYLPEESSDHG